MVERGPTSVAHRITLGVEAPLASGGLEAAIGDAFAGAPANLTNTTAVESMAAVESSTILFVPLEMC